VINIIFSFRSILTIDGSQRREKEKKKRRRIRVNTIESLKEPLVEAAGRFTSC